MIEENLTDEQLLGIIQSVPAGKELMSGTRITRDEAWQVLFKRYHPGMEKSAISKWHGDLASADETLQNTWIKVFRKIDTVKGRFKGWVYTVLENEFTDEIRKQTGRDEKVRFLSIDARAPWDIYGDDQRLGNVEREINTVYREQSAEDTAFAGNEDTSHTGFTDLASRFLSNDEARFFIKYQEEASAKSAADKKRYFDYRSKMMANMINQWLAQGRQLEEIMSRHQADALTRRFSLNQKLSYMFKEMGLCGKGELNALLASATSLLLQALIIEYPET